MEILSGKAGVADWWAITNENVPDVFGESTTTPNQNS
jgi:hypothetical protein